MEPDVVKSELVLPPVMPFKKIQMGDKYQKGQSRARYWKHLKQLLQAENFLSLPPDEPNCTIL
jgi:INO80 complex subunit C